MDEISQMLANHDAEDWEDVRCEDYVFDNEHETPLERLRSYIDYCFDEYDVVSDNLDREQVKGVLSNWDRRRGQMYMHSDTHRDEFGKRVYKDHIDRNVEGHYLVFLSKPLVGVSPDEDDGAGWKSCVRHELGHAIDYEQRGTCKPHHGKEFKAVMAQFGENNNEGGWAQGYPPEWHRKQ